MTPNAGQEDCSSTRLSRAGSLLSVPVAVGFPDYDLVVSAAVVATIAAYGLFGCGG